MVLLDAAADGCTLTDAHSATTKPIALQRFKPATGQLQSVREERDCDGSAERHHSSDDAAVVTYSGISLKVSDGDGGIERKILADAYEMPCRPRLPPFVASVQH
ncbi:hypothetical protein GCM10009856_41480 [Mycolicibacterium llatzerense]